jgi:transcriptional regulator with XRE-family HTH domain
MVNDEKSTVRSRELGDALRLAMERANLSGKHAAHVLNWSESKVSRMLTGRQPVKETDVSALLALCLVTGDEKERLLGLARDYNRRGWLQQYGSGLPELRTLINHENRAAAIYEFEPSFIPGLLQTGDYAQSLFEGSAILPPKEIEARVKARMGRQSLFSRDRQPRFTFFLHELIFRMPVGGPMVMADQMHHLLRMGVRSYITIRVIPAALGAHASVAGACRLMEFDELKPVVYIEEETAGHFLEERAEIATYRRIFTALANRALSEGESHDVIADLAVRLYADREDGHDGS